MIGHFLYKLIPALPRINRWQNKFKFENYNDATHTNSVCMIADWLIWLEENKFGNKVDALDVLRRCLYHDCIEIYTGDYLSGVKRRVKGSKEKHREIEESYYNEYVDSIVPPARREEMRRYWLFPKGDGTKLEDKIVAAADIISALIEAMNEVQLNNPQFKSYLQELSEDVLAINCESARYFLAHCLIDFEIPIKEFGPKIQNFIIKGEIEREC